MPFFDLFQGSKKFTLSTASIFSFTLRNCTVGKKDLVFPEDVISDWEISETKVGKRYTIVFKYKPAGIYSLGSFMENDIFSFNSFSTNLTVSWTDSVVDTEDAPFLEKIHCSKN